MYHSAVDAIITHSEKRHKPDESSIEFSASQRPTYGSINSLVADKLQIVAEYGVYDLLENIIDDTGEIRGIHSSEMLPIREAVWQLCQEKGVSAILPFHEERGSVGYNMAIAREWIGHNRAYGISTGSDQLSLNEARRYGGYVFEQQSVFETVNFNWQRLREIAGIDTDNIQSTKPLKGSKGITLLAGAILSTGLAEAGEINHDQIILWHDTDITNPQEYGAIPLTLWPYTQENSEISEVYMSMIARNGTGRNNEIVTFVVNRLLNSKDSLKAQFGYMLASSVWPLTGERAMRLSRLRNMPFASGMGLETVTNAYMAGVSSTERTGHVAHVLNPMPKKENKPSLPVREFTVINTAATMLMDISEHIGETRKFPNKWSVSDIRSYNEEYGGKPVNLFLQADTLAPQQPKPLQSDYIIPPINMLLEEGVITLP